MHSIINIALYVYDNNTCIVESFLPQPTQVNVVTRLPFKTLTDINTNESIKGEARAPQMHWSQPKNNSSNVFTVTIPAHSFKVFKFE